MTAAGNVVSTGGYFDGVLGASGDRAAAYVTTLDASSTLEAPDIYGVTTNQVEIGAYGTTEGLKLGYDNGPKRALLTVYDNLGAFALLRVSASALVMNGGNFDGVLGGSASASRNTAYVTSLDASTTVTAAGNVVSTGGYFDGALGASGDRDAAYVTSLDASTTVTAAGNVVSTGGYFDGVLGASGDRAAAYVTTLDASGNVSTVGYFDGVLGASGDRDAAYVTSLDASTTVSAAGNVETTGGYFKGVVGASGDRSAVYASSLDVSGTTTFGSISGQLGGPSDRNAAYVTSLDANDVIKVTGTNAQVEMGNYTTGEGLKLGYDSSATKGIITAYDGFAGIAALRILSDELTLESYLGGDVVVKCDNGNFKVDNATTSASTVMYMQNGSTNPTSEIYLANNSGTVYTQLIQHYSSSADAFLEFKKTSNSHIPFTVQAKTYINYNDMSLKVGDPNGVTYLGAGSNICTWSNGTGNGNGRIHINQSSGYIGTGVHTNPFYDLMLAGTLGVFAASYSSPSDERYKKNIKPSDLDACEQKVRNIELYDYEYIDQLNGSRKPNKAGFIAQQVQQVDPDCVNATEDVDPCVYAQRACALNADGKLVITGAALEDGVYEFYNSENETNISSCRYTIANNTVVEHEGVDPAKLGAWVFIVGIFRDDMLSIPKDRLTQYLFGTVKNLLNKVDMLTARIETLESQLAQP